MAYGAENQNLPGLWGCLVPGLGVAQRMDHTALFRQTSQQKSIRFPYDNDFFAAMDEYHTWIPARSHSSGLVKNILSRLLIKVKGQQAQYEVAIKHFGITLTSIQSKAIRLSDRPFSCGLLLKSFRLSTDLRNAGTRL